MTQQQDGAPELQQEFPRWDLCKSGLHGHRATRNDQPTTAQIKAGAKLLLVGDTLDELTKLLRNEERLLAKVKP